MPLAPDTLLQNEGSIDLDEPALGALVREVGQHERPDWELQVLMQALEKRRRAFGLGWSRPWNKIGMSIFRAHRHLLAADADRLHTAMETIREFAPEPLLSLPFIDDLFADPALMAFTFYHNRESGGAQYEGLTLSFGRQIDADHSRRDRLDLILEDRRVDGRVDGLVDLVRIIVCPWSSYGVDRDHQRLELCDLAGQEQERFDAIYRASVADYHAWKSDASRRWNHWSADYTGFFASRTFIPSGTSFT